MSHHQEETGSETKPVENDDRARLRVLSTDEETKEPRNDSPESNGSEVESEDVFFEGFSSPTEERDRERSEESFANGLKALFAEESAEESENEDRDANDPPTLIEQMEEERREGIDGVLRQEGAEFLEEAGRKYDAPSDSLGELGFEGTNRSAIIRPESVLEAALFVGDPDNKPLSLKKACEIMRDVSELEAIEALADLNERYYRDGSPYKIVREGDGFRMVLLPEYAEMISRSGKKTKEFKLSQTAVDVLALVAYRQPIALAEILDARENARPVLTQLIKRELISVEKRVVDNKSVSFYKTTDRFLSVFNLESLDDLPIVDDIDIR
ncbi:MAG: SMC-Scp complex subunit ScpB [Thermoguttaceae bacterium]|nr:SMC-Scp complex subunit ScpB [Thermoguttaceae bacterium]